MTDRATEGQHLPVGSTVRFVGTPLARLLCLGPYRGREEDAATCRHGTGNPEHDADLRDYENVPLGEDVMEYFERDGQPYVPEAWVDQSCTDTKDEEVGRLGYQINFNRYVYEYEPPQPLEEIEEEIREAEKEIVGMLGEVGM